MHATATGDAWVADLEKPMSSVLTEERRDYDAALAAQPSRHGEVELGMHVTIADGDTVVASSDADGGFLAMCDKFAAFVADRTKAASA